MSCICMKHTYSSACIHNSISTKWHTLYVHIQDCGPHDASSIYSATHILTYPHAHMRTQSYIFTQESKTSFQNSHSHNIWKTHEHNTPRRTRVHMHITMHTHKYIHLHTDISMTTIDVHAHIHMPWSHTYKCSDRKANMQTLTHIHIVHVLQATPSFTSKCIRLHKRHARASAVYKYYTCIPVQTHIRMSMWTNVFVHTCTCTGPQRAWGAPTLTKSTRPWHASTTPSQAQACIWWRALLDWTAPATTQTHTQHKIHSYHIHSDVDRAPHMHTLHVWCARMHAYHAPKQTTHSKVSDVRLSNTPAGSTLIWLSERLLRRHIPSAQSSVATASPALSTLRAAACHTRTLVMLFTYTFQVHTYSAYQLSSLMWMYAHACIYVSIHVCELKCTHAHTHIMCPLYALNTKTKVTQMQRIHNTQTHIQTHTHTRMCVHTTMQMYVYVSLVFSMVCWWACVAHTNT